MIGRLKLRRAAHKGSTQQGQQAESVAAEATPAQPPAAPQPAATFSATFVGATLVVGPPEGAGQAAATLARSLPADRGRTVVVVDTPPSGDANFWQSVATALQGRGPVRLATSHAGSMRPTAPAHWLAEQLQTEVIAPDGVLTTVPGSAFVIGAQGYGCWVRFRPGAAPMPFGRRFPVPQWEAMDPNSSWPTGEVGVSEPIPAGLWLRAQKSPFDPATPDARPIVSLPCRDNVLSMVIGGPQQPQIPTEEICRLLTALPYAARSRVRLVPYGMDASGGQLVAEQLGEPISMYTGLPVANLRNGTGAAVVAVDSRGQQTWRPFVTEVRCVPGATVADVTGYRPPVAGLTEVGSGIFSLGDGVVLEVVASGLWVREVGEPFNAADVRAQPVDPEWARLTVGTPGRATPGAVAVAGAALVERLEPEVRKLLRVVFCDVTVAAPPPPPPPPPPPVPVPVPVPVPAGITAPECPPENDPPRGITAPESPKPDDPPAQTPVRAGITRAAEVHYGAVMPSAEMRIRLEGPLPMSPVPSWELRSRVGRETVDDRETVPADHRSTDLERDAVRRALGERYGSHAAAICRVLAQRSGAQEDPESFEAMVTDLTALSACFSQDEEMMTGTLRIGRLGRLRPYVACVVSGLSRLPVHNGVTACWGAGGPSTLQRYRTGDILTEPGMLNTIANPGARTDGRVEYLVWSVTGRKIEVADRLAAATQERVIFPPGSAFRVLAVVEPEDSAPMQVMLQEVVGLEAEQQIGQLRPSVLSQLERAASALRSISTGRHQAVPQDA